MAAPTGLITVTVTIGTGSSGSTRARQHDAGATLRVLVTEDGATGVDISTATTYEIVLRSPKGDDNRKTTAFTTTGTDGNIECTLAATDLAKAGNWRVYAKVVMPSGLDVRSVPASLTVASAPT